MRTKQQHFVPQSYLRRFTSDGKTIQVLDKPNLRTFTSNVRNIAGETGFYNLPTEGAEALGIDPQVAEKALSDLEQSFDAAVGTVLERAAAGDLTVLDARLRRNLAHFLVVQDLRTREKRSAIRQVIEKFGEALAESYPDLKGSAIRAEADEQWLGLFQTAQLFNPEMLRMLTSALLDHIWFLGHSCTGRALYTSDHPFVRRAHYQQPHMGTLGLASPGIELACPLSSSYVLVLSDRVAFREYEDRDNKVLDLEADNVTYYNSLQVLQSYRQVYCSANAFELALQICRERPYVRDPDKIRVVVE